MLSKTYFDRELITIYEEKHYEVIRPLGHPMILFHGETGQAIASIHFCCEAGHPTFITKRNSSTGLDFQGVIAEDKQAISFVVTNLLFHDPIVVNIMRGELQVNDINFFDPGKSVRIRGDASAGNKTLILDTAAASASATTVREDEARPGGPKGAYFTIAVFPASASGGKFNTAVWQCADLICRPREPEPPMAFGYNEGHRPTQAAIEFFRNVSGNGRGGFRPDLIPEVYTRMRGAGSFDPNPFRDFDNEFAIASHDPVSPTFSPSSPSYGASGGGFGAPTIEVHDDEPSPLATFSVEDHSAPFSMAPRSASGGGFGSFGPSHDPVSPAFSPSSPSYGGGFTNFEDTARAANIVHGTTAEAQPMEEIDDDDLINYACGSPPATLCLSVICTGIEMLPQLTKAAAFDRAVALTRDTILDGNKQLVKSLTAVHKADECVICMEGAPDVIFIKCGHQCVHEACARQAKNQTCPLCRATIVAKIHV